jgi:hypothetical protein
MRNVKWLLVAGLLGCTGQDSDTDEADTDSDTDADSDTDTDTDADVDGCAPPVVTFEMTDGSTQDLTDYFTTGDYFTLAVDGTLSVCPATWYSRVLIRANVDIVGLGALPKDTVMSGGESGTILDIAGPNVIVSVSNVTLDRGAGLDVDHNSGGGGIYCAQEGVVTVTDVRFTNNFANDGPGLYSNDCVVDIHDSRFVDNLSEDDGGAATFWFSTATLDHVLFDNNVALDGGAMAIFSSDVTVTDSTIQNNTSTSFAAGVWGHESNLWFTDTVFENNNNDGTTQYGGGLIVYGTAELNEVTFRNNSAPKGGGIFVYYEGVVDGNNCSFEGNDPDDIYAADYSRSGGVSYSAGPEYSFTCANNVCTED